MNIVIGKKPTTKSKPLHPMRGNREFYSCNRRCKIPYYALCIPIRGAKLGKKGIECSLTMTVFFAILTVKSPCKPLKGWFYPIYSSLKRDFRKPKSLFSIVKRDFGRSKQGDVNRPPPWQPKPWPCRAGHRGRSPRGRCTGRHPCGG